MAVLAAVSAVSVLDYVMIMVNIFVPDLSLDVSLFPSAEIGHIKISLSNLTICVKTYDTAAR